MTDKKITVEIGAMLDAAAYYRDRDNAKEAARADQFADELAELCQKYGARLLWDITKQAPVLHVGGFVTYMHRVGPRVSGIGVDGDASRFAWMRRRDEEDRRVGATFRLARGAFLTVTDYTGGTYRASNGREIGRPMPSISEAVADLLEHQSYDEMSDMERDAHRLGDAFANGEMPT